MRAVALFLILMMTLTFTVSAGPPQTYSSVPSPAGTYYVTSQYEVYKESNLRPGLQPFLKWDSACGCWIWPDDRVVPVEETTTCLPYNARALTNMCIYTARMETPVPTVFATHTQGSQEVCVVSNRCADVPTITMSPVTQDNLVLVRPHGFVEFTGACGASPVCRLSLP